MHLGQTFRHPILARDNLICSVPMKGALGDWLRQFSLLANSVIQFNIMMCKYDQLIG